MSLTPAFELGLWNARIITVLGFLTMGGGLFPIFLINNEITKKRERLAHVVLVFGTSHLGQ